jgi:integrase
MARCDSLESSQKMEAVIPTGEPRRRRKSWQRGSIYKRGAGYAIVYRKPDGAQKWESGFPTKGKAQERLNDVMGLIKHKKFLDDPQDKVFKQWCAEWLETQKTNIKPSTWSSYRSAVDKWLIPKFGDWYVSDITRRSVIGFFDELQAQKLSRKFVKNVHVLMHKIFKDALYRELTANNPADGITLQKAEGQAEYVVLQPAEVVKTFAQLDSTYQVLLAAGAITGMRRAELLGLRWEDVDFKGGTLQVCRTLQRVKKSLLDAAAFDDVERIGTTGLALVSPKSRKSRRAVEIPPKLALLFRELQRKQNNGGCFVFQDALGRPLDPDGLYDVLHLAQDAAGVRSFGLHALRHLYCSLLQESGASVKHAQMKMGHASPLTTLNIYTHTVTDEGRKYAEKVEAAFPFVSGVLVEGSQAGGQQEAIQ